MEHLPPGPFSYETVRALSSTHEGAGHVYLVDRDGRKIAALWGRPEEKLALADLIIKARAFIDADLPVISVPPMVKG